MDKALYACSLVSVFFLFPAVAAPSPARAPGQILIKLKEGARTRFNPLNYSGVQVQRELALLAGRFMLLATRDREVDALLPRLRGDESVAYAEPNYLWGNSGSVESDVRAELTEALVPEWRTPDERFALQWGMSNKGDNEPDKEGAPSGDFGTVGADINALEAWRASKGSTRVVVGVVDGGVDYRHPELAGNMWVNPGEIPGNGKDDDKNGYVDDVHGYNFREQKGDPMDGSGHGTHCAGTIGALHGNGGVVGMMPEVSIMALRFLSSSGNGDTVNAIEAIDYGTRMGANILNNSWGGGPYSRALYDAIKAAGERGVVFVAAAGNQGRDVDRRAYYPGSYRLPNVISVGAHAHTGTLSASSNYGKESVHVVAPGRNILSTAKGGGYKVMSGTSMAAPHVSGLLGLLLAKEGNRSPAELRERLMATTMPTSGFMRTTLGGGRVDAGNFLHDVRPARPIGPSPEEWQAMPLEEPYETAHPYAPGTRTSRTLRVPGARYVRLVVTKHALEYNYDFLSVRDQKGVVVARVTGSGTNLVTDYAEGDTLTLEFSSDSMEEDWGISAKEVQYVR